MRNNKQFKNWNCFIYFVRIKRCFNLDYCPKEKQKQREKRDKTKIETKLSKKEIEVNRKSQNKNWFQETRNNWTTVSVQSTLCIFLSFFLYCLGVYLCQYNFYNFIMRMSNATIFFFFFKCVNVFVCAFAGVCVCVCWALSSFHL